MSARRIGAALLGAWMAFSIAACSERAPEPAAHDWTADPRLITLFTPCAQPGHFDGDTSDLVPVLVGKLSTAQLDVLRNLREELAALGAPVLAPLGAYVRRHYGETFGVPALRNALVVLRLTPAPEARELLRLCLEHLNEDVRAAAAAGLAVHATPEDYEPLSTLLAPGVANESTRATVLGAMYRADPERLMRDALGWFRAGEHSDLWLEAARCVADSGDAEVGAQVGELLADFPGERARPFLLAAWARGGDPAAMTELLAMLRDGSLDERSRVVEALDLSGAPGELEAALTDPDEVLRSRAASLIALHLPEEWARAALLGCLNDASFGVRQTAIQALLEIGELRAADAVLAWLSGDRHELEAALLCVRESWSANPELAPRAADLLMARLEELEGRSLEEQKACLQALGQIPDARAAALLLERARAEEGELDQLSAQRWLVRQVGNTDVGRALAAQAWRAESEPELRFDLLEAVSFGREVATREFLLEVLDAQRSTPFEVLFVAERLARQGPSTEIAPILKRAALRQTHRDVRPAMDCLMWRWYGPES